MSTDVIELSCASLSSIGDEACRVVQQNPTGRVVAAFRRSFYVQNDDGIVCVGMASLGRGPLHVLLQTPRDTVNKDPVGRVITGQPVRFYDAGLINHLQSYNGSVMENMNSRFSEHLCYSECSRRAISIIDQCALSATEGCGFSWLLSKACWDSDTGFVELSLGELDVVVLELRKQTYPALQCLYEWLEGSIENATNDYSIQPLIVPPEIVALSGAGPGLTPAGDDLLAGVLLALHRINLEDLADRLWARLSPCLATRTNAISGAHLKMAAQGRCSESVVCLLNAMTCLERSSKTNTIQSTAQDIQAKARGIGGSSGWDTLAGISLVLRAMSRAKLFLPPLEGRPRFLAAVNQPPLGQSPSSLTMEH